jgi:hypothetical protein
MEDDPKDSDHQLVVDVIGNALDSLARAVEFAAEAHQNPFAWKWVCIAQHNALYGFAIAILGQGNPLPAWLEKPKDGKVRLPRRLKKLVRKLEKKLGREPDSYEILVETHRTNNEPQIIRFLDAIKKVSESVRFEHPVSRGLDEQRLTDIVKLAQLRNIFNHYPPSTSYVWTAYDFIPAVESAAEVTSMFVCNSIEGRMLVPECREKVGHLVDALLSELEAFGPVPQM